MRISPMLRSIRGLQTSHLRLADAQTQITNSKSSADAVEKQMRNLASIQTVYMDKLNQKRMEKHQKEKRLRTHYRITGSLLFAFVISVYFYSMYAVSQEKFLDDFEVPKAPTKQHFFHFLIEFIIYVFICSSFSPILYRYIRSKVLFNKRGLLNVSFFVCLS